MIVHTLIKTGEQWTHVCLCWAFYSLHFIVLGTRPGNVCHHGDTIINEDIPHKIAQGPFPGDLWSQSVTLAVLTITLAIYIFLKIGHFLRSTWVASVFVISCLSLDLICFKTFLILLVVATWFKSYLFWSTLNFWIFVFLWCWGLNSGVCICQARALPLSYLLSARFII